MKPNPMRRMVQFALAGLAAAALALLAYFYRDVHALFDRAINACRDAGPVPFFLAMALLPAVGFPLAMFTVVVGPVFVPTLGLPTVLACTLLAVTVNVALSYWISARALRPLSLRVLRFFGHRLPEIRPQATWPLILLVRIVPGPPFWLQSYLLGLARVPFGSYMLVSTIVPAAYIIATIVLTDALMRHDPWAIATAGAIFFVAGGVLHQVRRRLQARTEPARPLKGAAAPAGESLPGNSGS